MGRLLHDWAAIQAYHDAGHGFVECSKKFGFTHTAWNKAIKSGRLRSKATPFKDRRRKYDWAKIQAYVDAGFTLPECAIRFGFQGATWTDAVRRGELRARSRVKPLELMLRNKMKHSCIKRRLLELHVFEDRCSRCGITEWSGKRLTIHLDHVNGIKDDWRIENLRMLCPNCHSQTPTFGGRNLRRFSLLLWDYDAA